MGATCHRDAPVVLIEGPKATELGRAKDEQISGLKAQVLAAQEARTLEQKQASLAAANFDGILFAAQHVETGLPRTAIEEEARLGKERSPAPDPQEVIKAKDRVIAILQNEVAKAKALYDEARGAATKAQDEIKTKDKAIAESKTAIDTREARIAILEQEKTDEAAKHALDVTNALKAKDDAFEAYKKAESEKERRWLVNSTRIAALGLIVAGAVALAAFKMVGVGSGLVGAGVLVGLISLGIETLTSQKWWPYLCGTVFVGVAGAAVYGVYRLWVKHMLDDKKTLAIQDMIDEGAAKGDTAAVDELKAHLTYRMGNKTSFWGAQQTKEVVKLGLVEPKGEKTLEAAPVVPDVKTEVDPK